MVLLASVYRSARDSRAWLQVKSHRIPHAGTASEFAGTERKGIAVMSTRLHLKDERHTSTIPYQQYHDTKQPFVLNTFCLPR